jgi:RNA polymerase sigma factor for flagellar operon FliA
VHLGEGTFRRLRDALEAHYAADPDGEFTPVSKTAPARRSAYLSRVATNAAVGIARAMREPDAAVVSTAV